MAGLEEIRQAIKDTVDANVQGLRAYAAVEDIVNLPALLVLPVDADFTVTAARGFDRHNLDLFVMVSRTVPRVGQNSLDAFVSGSGSQSIRAAIFANRTLGLASTDAHVSGMSRYGGTFPAASIEHIGAALRLVVTTPGTT